MGDKGDGEGAEARADGKYLRIKRHIGCGGNDCCVNLRLGCDGV